MEKQIDIKKELIKLNYKFEKDKQNIIKKCKHIWEEDGYESHKYGGMQYYKCSVCSQTKGESY